MRPIDADKIVYSWQVDADGQEHDGVTLQSIIDKMPAISTLYGYPVEHLARIAMVLQKENLPPERVAEMLSNVGRIVEMARDEFEEKLRKAVEGRWS